MRVLRVKDKGVAKALGLTPGTPVFDSLWDWGRAIFKKYGRGVMCTLFGLLVWMAFQAFTVFAYVVFDANTYPDDPSQTAELSFYIPIKANLAGVVGYIVQAVLTAIVFPVWIHERGWFYRYTNFYGEKEVKK